MQQNAYMQSKVQYFKTNLLSINGQLGLLEWSGDGHIRLFSIDPSSNQPTGIVFDCLPSQISKASSSFSLLRFKIGSNGYRVEFSPASLMAGGLVGLYIADKQRQQSGVQWWVDNLKNQGIKVDQLSMGRMVKLTLLTMLVMIILVIAFFVIFA